jgi:hypothetical protein
VQLVMEEVKQKMEAEPQQIQATLVAHSHYDHMQDLPYLLTKKHLASSCRIIGSHSVYNALKSTVQDTFTFIRPVVQTVNDPHWIQLYPGARVSVIGASHADHFEIFGKGIHQMQGCVPETGIKKFNARKFKSPSGQWLEGEVYAFMIDLLDNQGNKKLRLFVQSSSCDTPGGIPLYTPLLKDSVDIAVIGVASANFTKEYPKTLLQTIKPKYVVLVHWEDFFRKYHKGPYKIVRATKFEEFAVRYNDWRNMSIQTTMPEPGTLLKIRY